MTRNFAILKAENSQVLLLANAEGIEFVSKFFDRYNSIICVKFPNYIVCYL